MGRENIEGGLKPFGAEINKDQKGSEFIGVNTLNIESSVLHTETMEIIAQDFGETGGILEEQEESLMDHSRKIGERGPRKLAAALSLILILATTGCTPGVTEAGDATLDSPARTSVAEESEEADVIVIPTPTELPTPIPTPELKLPKVDNSWTGDEMGRLMSIDRGFEEWLMSYKPENPRYHYFYFVVNKDRFGYTASGPPYNKEEQDGKSIFAFLSDPRLNGIVEEDIWDKVVEAVPKESKKRNYDMIFFSDIGEDEYGEYDVIYFKDGGFFRIDKTGNVSYIPLDKMAKANLTKDEIEWIEEGYSIFDYRFGTNGVGRAKDPRGLNSGDEENEQIYDS